MYFQSKTRSTACLLATLALICHAVCLGVDEQIIGGTPAVAGEVPFLMQVLSGSTYLCTASLIHPNWAISYAYRIYRVPNITLRLSSLRTDGDYEPYRLEYYVQNTNTLVFFYPEFTGYPMHSIAVIKMPYTVPLSPASARPKRISTLPLARTAEMRQTYVGLRGKMCGWGIWDPVPFMLSRELRCKESNSIISFKECNESRSRQPLHDGTFCTKWDNVACYGDGGSPFLVPQGAGFKVIGTSAWIQTDCGWGPEGFMKVAYYYNWIRSVSGNAV